MLNQLQFKAAEFHIQGTSRLICWQKTWSSRWMLHSKKYFYFSWTPHFPRVLSFQYSSFLPISFTFQDLPLKWQRKANRKPVWGRIEICTNFRKYNMPSFFIGKVILVLCSWDCRASSSQILRKSNLGNTKTSYDICKSDSVTLTIGIDVVLLSALSLKTKYQLISTNLIRRSQWTFYPNRFLPPWAWEMQ